MGQRSQSIGSGSSRPGLLKTAPAVTSRKRSLPVIALAQSTPLLMTPEIPWPDCVLAPARYRPALRNRPLE